MDFSKKLLEKYGWKEGQGLGKNSDGIANPLKANLKFDNSGIGHTISDDLNNRWWENVYNKSANNLAVKNDGECSFDLVNNESIEVSTKNYLVKNKNSDKYKGTFLKGKTLHKSIKDSDDEEIDEITEEAPILGSVMTEEDLLKACGGRTAHKGARHGLKLSGKLNRIERQEMEMLKTIQSKTSSSLPHSDSIGSIFKNYIQENDHILKSKKRKEKKSPEIVEEEEVVYKKKSKKRKREQNLELLEETANTEIVPPPVEEPKKKKKKSKKNKDIENDEDEINVLAEVADADFILVKKKKKKSKLDLENSSAAIDVDVTDDTHKVAAYKKTKT